MLGDGLRIVPRLRGIAGNTPLTRSCQFSLVSASASRRIRVVPGPSPSLPREGLSRFRRSLLGRPATFRLGQAALS
jgi:hypothetical protein